MVLTPRAIAKARSDDNLYQLLSSELKRLLGGSPASDRIHEFVPRLARLPIGLRAMAATYELDVSITLDGFADHFANWHDLGFAEETLRGLHELGALELEGLFAEALEIAHNHWELFGSDYPRGYRGSEVEALLNSLDQRAWVAFGLRDRPGRSILAHWPEYARAHPERVCEAA